jgi:predicted RNA-binding protein with PUA-like domain
VATTEDGFALFEAEIRRRGGTAQRMPGLEAVVEVRDRDARVHRVRLKTKKSGDWQDTKKSRLVRPPHRRIDAWAFVDVRLDASNISIVEHDWMRKTIASDVDAWLSRDPSRNADTETHHRITDAQVIDWRGRWDIIGLSEIATVRNDSVTVSNLGAWVFKCNPKTWDLETFVADGHTHIEDWSVANNYRSELIQHGQRALFWVSGAEDGAMPRGIWGYGWTTGRRRFVAQPYEGYWEDDDKRIDSQWYVDTDLHLLDAPVTSAELKQIDRLSDLEVLRQPYGSNPSWVSQTELAAIEDLLPPWPELGKPAGTPITVSERGAGFGDPVTNKLIENAAVDAVTDYYRDQFHCEVTDVGSQKLGWDLSCAAPDGTLYRVEVKGVAGGRPSILLTRNELRSAREDPNWELAVVTKALSSPTVSIYYPEDVIDIADSMVYRVDLPPV